MIVEEIYLENKTTRKAFYHVRIVKEESSKQTYKVEVHWGRLGSVGKVTSKKRTNQIEVARIEMHKLAEAKKMRHYHEISKPKANPKAIQGDTPTKPPSFDAQRFLSLELE